MKIRWCLSSKYVPLLTQHSWDECKRVFGSDQILLVSNSAGTTDDPHALAAESVSSNLGIPVLCHDRKKPSKRCAKEIVDYFRDRAQRGPAPSAVPQILVVGDRITTDVVLANRIGHVLQSTYPTTPPDLGTPFAAKPSLPLCVSMLTTQLWAPEAIGTRLMRGTENRILHALVRAGIPPGGGWRTRSAYAPPSWDYDRPAASALPAVASPTPTSVWMQAADAQFSPRTMRFVRATGRGLARIGQIGIVARATRHIRAGLRVVLQEVASSVQQSRSLLWSALTAAPTKRYASSWQTQAPRALPPALRHAGVPPVGSMRTAKRTSRAFSSCAGSSAHHRAAHERPVLRARTPVPEAEVPLSAPPPPVYLGMAVRQWIMAVFALILLPLGFMGGMKLNDSLTRWRDGTSLDDEAPSAPVEPLTAETQAAVEQDMAHLPAIQLAKRIQRYVPLLTQPGTRPLHPAPRT